MNVISNEQHKQKMQRRKEVQDQRLAEKKAEKTIFSNMVRHLPPKGDVHFVSPGFGFQYVRTQVRSNSSK